MKQRVLWMGLLVAGQLLLGCGGSRTSAPPEQVALMPGTTGAVVPLGNFVIRNEGPAAWSVDMTDASDPTTLDTWAGAGIGCPDLGCVGFDVRCTPECAAYFMNGSELSSAALPGSGAPLWIFDLPNRSTMFYPETVFLNNGDMALIGLSLVDGSGHLVSLDLSTGSPVTAMDVPLPFAPLHIVEDQGRVYVGGDQSIAVVTGTDAYSLTILSIINLSVGSPDLDQIAVVGDNLIVTGSDAAGNYRQPVAWFRFAPDFATAAKVVETDTYLVGGCCTVPPLIEADRVLLSSFMSANESGSEIVVLALDTANALVELHSVREPGGNVVGRLSVDQGRHLLYAGGSAMWVLDLDQLTQ